MTNDHDNPTGGDNEEAHLVHRIGGLLWRREPPLRGA